MFLFLYGEIQGQITRKQRHVVSSGEGEGNNVVLSLFTVEYHIISSTRLTIVSLDPNDKR